ncbi:MAG: hypothetical protein DWQ31_04250 [Planctomycetota bacterium]|nr:MAG: hypothetical protein DWQ31_04250 [Planctomycetota bacterium]REK25818.1 MAG: hypothetical protein DWQ42_10420 [Planctomycetota bacterium]REK49489.1 MAG: hypothetical protein DWQ46_00125 [Planctomycetota bacterium]
MWYFSDIQPRLVVHDDGTLTEAQLELFGEHFRGCRVVLRSESDELVGATLSDYHHARRYRFDDHHPLSLKLFDINIIAKEEYEEYIVVLDSDVVFFSEPRELLGNISRKTTCVMADVGHGLAVHPPRLAEFAPDLTRSRVNTGIMAIYPAVLDLARIDRFLGNLFRCKPEHVDRALIEQTCYALLFSGHQEEYRFLSRAYHLPFWGVGNWTQACHYFGETKPLFQFQGIQRLVRGSFGSRLGS